MGRLGAALFVALGLAGAPLPAAGPPLQGVVLGAAQAPLVGVRVMADEVGISRDTDSRGAFSLTLPPEIEKRGIVRLSFSLENHQTRSLEIKVPLARLLEITLTPLYPRTVQPTLPPALTGRLRIYRKEEVRQVQAFLASKETKILAVEGIAGVGSVDVVLVALQDLPRAARRPILWWDCEENDSLTVLAEDLARSLRDQNLGNLAERRDEVDEPRDRQEADRETLARILARLESRPYTIVLNRFDRWLSGDGQSVEDPALAEFLSRTAAHPQAGKVILVSDLKPAVPPDLNPAWIETLAVRGLDPSESLDFLTGHLGVKADAGLLRDAAARLGGHPFALQLLAGSLKDASRNEQENRLRQFLQVGESLFGGRRLGPLLATARARLTPLEGQILDVLTVVRQPLTVDEMQEIGVDRAGQRFTSDEIRSAVERLARDRSWLETFQDARTGEERYRLGEVARLFLEDAISADRSWKTELHRKALAWIQQEFPAAAMDPMKQPSPEVIAGYDELVHHAFSLAELAEGDERQQALGLGGLVLQESWNWHIVRDSNRLLLSRWRRAQRLSERLQGPAGRLLRAHAEAALGELYHRTARLDEAGSRYEEALRLYRELGDRLGEANVLSSLGTLYGQTGRNAEAEARYGEALAIYGEVDHGRLGEASTLRSLGELYARAARHSEAEALQERALPLYRAIGSRHGEANTLKSLGDVAFRKSRFAEAEGRYRAALPLFRASGSRQGEANTLRFLGDLFLRTARPGEAGTHYEQALSLFRAIEDRRGEANTLKSLGDLDSRTARLGEAETRYEQALSLARAVGDRQGEANILAAQGNLFVQTVRLAEAKASFEAALPLYRTEIDPLGEANVLLGIGLLRSAEGSAADAEEQIRAARSLYVTIGERVGQINCALVLSDLYRGEGRMEEALREALTGFLVSRAIHLPDTGPVTDRLVWMRLELGREAFDLLAKRAVATFLTADQETLGGVLDLVRGRFEGRG